MNREWGRQEDEKKHTILQKNKWNILLSCRQYELFATMRIFHSGVPCHSLCSTIQYWATNWSFSLRRTLPPHENKNHHDLAYSWPFKLLDIDIFYVCVCVVYISFFLHFFLKKDTCDLHYQFAGISYIGIVDHLIHMHELNVRETLQMNERNLKMIYDLSFKLKI